MLFKQLQLTSVCWAANATSITKVHDRVCAVVVCLLFFALLMK